MAAIRLEPMLPEHVETTLSWLRDGELRAAIDSQGPPNPEEHAAYWARRLAARDEEAYAVTADSHHVGNGGLLVEPRRRKAELWLYIGEPAWRGAGVGREAGLLLLERAFGGLGLMRTAVRVVSTNPGALRFWRSLGFVEEGRLRMDAGDADSIWLGLLRSEWAGRP